MADQVRIIELYCDKETQPSMNDVAMKIKVSKATIHQWLQKAEECGLINYETREKIYEQDLRNIGFTKRQEARMKLKIEKEKKRKAENMALADKFESFVDAALSELNERDLSEEKTTDLVKAAGTAVDKMRLLRDESTKNVMKQRKSIVEMWSHVDTIPLEDQLKMIGDTPEIEEAEVIPQNEKEN